jgi:hypothetical protein
MDSSPHPKSLSSEVTVALASVSSPSDPLDAGSLDPKRDAVAGGGEAPRERLRHVPGAQNADP